MPITPSALRANLYKLIDEVIATGQPLEIARKGGGHIGYDTVPAYCGQGVATQMLRRALPVARQLGLTEVLLTC
jgi:RimJ/RimL family protein N-acetyltransferase